jgi:hypothetical protein
MGELFDDLRNVWRLNFTLPGRGNRNGWGSFVFGWFWSLAAVVPGAHDSLAHRFDCAAPRTVIM